MSDTTHGRSALAHHFEDLGNQKETATLGMWAFLAQEILFFGGLFLVYALYRNLYYPVFEASSHALDWKLGAINTGVLICSSLTMAMAVHAAALGHRNHTALWLVGTIVLGAEFLGVKVVEYHEKWAHGLIPGLHWGAPEQIEHALHLSGADAVHAQLYFSLYFAMTGLHALHMIIGIPILGWLAARAWRGHFGPDYHTPVELTGLYWHFVDIIWIFLFPLLYLIGHH